MGEYEKPRLCRLGVHWDRIHYTGTSYWWCNKFGCDKSTVPDHLPTTLVIRAAQE